MKKLPEGLLHLSSLKELELLSTDLDPEDDVTWERLQGRSLIFFPALLPLVAFVLLSISVNL